MENQGESPNGHTLQSLENNGQSGHLTNGNLVSSSGEATGVQHVITTVMSSSNGNHHSAESLQDCGSPEIQAQHPMPATPLTPNTNGSEVDLSRVKMEPEAMHVIVKQEPITTGQGGEKIAMAMTGYSDSVNLLASPFRTLQLGRQRGLKNDVKWIAKHQSELTVRVFHKRQQQHQFRSLAEYAHKQWEWCGRGQSQLIGAQDLDTGGYGWCPGRTTQSQHEPN